jgi:hypothetical protein
MAMSGHDDDRWTLFGRGRVPLWLKFFYSLFLCVLVPVYWRQFGLTHFLWASDIALLLVFVALWLEKPLLNSMVAIGVVPFEFVWIIDFLSGANLFGVTAYMFSDASPLYLRSLSLFHLFLPPLVLFLLYRLGYDRRALPAQIMLAWLVLPATHLLGDPAENINYTVGLGGVPQTIFHPLLYLGLQMILLPAVIFWPAHLVLRRFFRR